MWELDHKESWALKNWCFWTVVLKKTLDSPLDCKEIKLVNCKANQSWIFTGKTDAEAENSNTEVTWYKELTHWKRPWCWETLKAGGDGDNRGWDGRMASPTQWTWVWAGVGDGQGSLAFCSPCGHKESDTTEWLNNSNILPSPNPSASDLYPTDSAHCPNTILPFSSMVLN